MLADDVKIVRQMEERSYGPDLAADVKIRVEFMVGKHGPFVEKFPKDGFTAAQRDDVLTTFANEVRTT